MTDAVERLDSFIFKGVKHIHLQHDWIEIKSELARHGELWECSECGFRMSAEHYEKNIEYPCPVCSESRLEIELERLREENEQWKTEVKRLKEAVVELDKLNKAERGRGNYWMRQAK